jgi:low affinity Fe/Cu permease
MPDAAQNHATHHTELHRHAKASMNTVFSRFAQRIAALTGHPVTFLLAMSVIVVWVVTGPIFGYSDTWQLIINTGTTIVTFLMVFLIQNTQNRDMITVQLKLSELVLAMKGAENKFASIEDMTDEELEILHNECRARAEMTLGHLQSRRGEIGDKPSKRTAAHAARHASKSVTRKSRAPKR